jgi:hypothetical protein
MTNVDCVRPSTVLLVETHSPSDSLDSGDFLGFADSLLRQGSAVHLHLMQNGVLWVQRRSTSLTHIKQAFGEQVTLTCAAYRTTKPLFTPRRSESIGWSN